MSLNKTKRYSRHTYGDNGAGGKRNILSVSFVASDLGAPRLANTTSLKAATSVSNLAATTLTPTAILDCPRNVTITVAATVAADIAAGNIVVTGKNVEGKTITENFAVTADTAATITGNLAFASVTSVLVPQQDGDSVTVAIGRGAKIGIGMRNIASMPSQVYTKTTAGVEAIEAAGATAFSATLVEGNTVTTTTALDGATQFRVYVLNYKFALNPTNATPDYGV